MSNSEIFPKSHDEIDSELLGDEKRKDWVLQTNVYGNGSVSTGREEKFYLWFDPTEDFHQYSILWNYHHIVQAATALLFSTWLQQAPVMVQQSELNLSTMQVPSRQHSGARGLPQRGTIWDGSQRQLTEDRNRSTITLHHLVHSLKIWRWVGVHGLRTNPRLPAPGNNQKHHQGQGFIKLSQQQKIGMDLVRGKFMFYSYCNDPKRFSVKPPACKERKPE